MFQTFDDIKNTPWNRYEDKMSTLAEIIKSNTKSLHSLRSKKSVYDLPPILLKNIDEVFEPFKK